MHQQYYLFIRPLLERLAQPAFFSRIVANALRVTGALIALLSLTLFFKIGKLTFDLSAHQVLGGFLFEAFLILAVYATVHIFVIRARDIESLKSADVYAIVILGLLLKLASEAYFAFITLMAIGAGVFVWFTNQGLSNILGSLVHALLPSFGDDSTFMGGIELMASGVLAGLGALVLGYATSQALSLLVRPARNGVQPFPSTDTTQPYRSRFGAGS